MPAYLISTAQAKAIRHRTAVSSVIVVEGL
jgi:hypothetical protein